MPQPNDLSRSLVALDQNSTIIAVIEMSQSSWLVAGLLPGIERQPRKKLEPSPERLLGLLHRWQDEAVRAGRTITRIALAFEAGRDGFWLARWLTARGIEAHVIHASSVAVSREHRRAKTDRLDTELLKRGFLGWLRGERGHCRVTEGGQNAIARIDPATRAVKLFPLPKERRDANLNTASFDRQGVLWFTGQNGIYGRLDPKTGAMAVFDAPRGTGPYGIATTPDGQVFFASLAGNYLGQIDLETGATTVLEPPVPRQGARRVWSDSRGALWITGWNSGDLFRYDIKSKTWARWHLPGDGPQPYAVYVDEIDAVWVSDWGGECDPAL